jgi:caffeoyl-CoA O-methyltransferase
MCCISIRNTLCSRISKNGDPKSLVSSREYLKVKDQYSWLPADGFGFCVCCPDCCTIYVPTLYFCEKPFKLELINPLVQAYSEKYTGREEELLHEIAATTSASHPKSHMLSGHVQGKFLEMISRLMMPSRILEIGTFTGYSALCLAKGLLKDGQLHTIELREEDAATARANFNRSNLVNKIILHTGNALTIIPELKEIWDLVFIDADKTGYLDYYKLVLPKLRPGGVIIADNVLFHGQVLETPVSTKNARAIQAFNEYVYQDHTVEKVLLTVRDGLLMIRKNE